MQKLLMPTVAPRLVLAMCRTPTTLKPHRQYCTVQDFPSHVIGSGGRVQGFGSMRFWVQGLV